MSEVDLMRNVSRRGFAKTVGAGVLAASTALPLAQHAGAIPAKQDTPGEKSATVYFGNKPYSNWTGIRFWANTGIPSRLQWEPLLDLDENLEIDPALVESWEVVSDTLTRYHLRSGITWSDGTPITAEDVVFSLNLTFNKDLATLMSSEISSIAGGDEMKTGAAETLSGVRALDSQTFEIETAVPDSTIVRTLALRWWAPLPKHVYESVDPASLMSDETFLQPPVVSGPFKIDRIEVDKWYEMSANTSYFRGKAKLDNLTYVIGNIGDPVALASQGAFHYYIARQPDIAAALSENPDYSVEMVEYIQPMRWQINCGNPKYADPRFRKAVAYAIDRDTLCGEIYRGSATPQYTDFLGDLLSPEAEVYGYDPDHARKLLSEANWDPNEIMYYDRVAPQAGQAIDPVAEAQFAAFQQWLADVGIKMEQRLSPDPATFADMTHTQFTYESFENPHRPYHVYGPLEMKVYLQSTPTNYAVWENEQADTLIAEAVATTDPARYVEVGRELSILVADEGVYVPTKANHWGIVAHKSFTGYTPIGEAYFAHLRPYDWDIVED